MLQLLEKNGSIIERCIDENGQESITHYDVIKEISNISVVHFTLETGRTHQIRVHSNFIGHPILGDTLYGKASPLISRQALHAFKVSFIHPITKHEMVIGTDIPKDMIKVISKPVSRVLLKIVIYLEYILLYISSRILRNWRAALCPKSCVAPGGV